ncbi:MAG: LysR family transcriptional regulator [Bacteroidota bacterium]
MLENYQIEFRHLRYFLVVAEELHFRRAAERLFMAQPGLSRQIQQLEKALGVALFTRHNRKVVLTPAGIFLQREAGQLLAQLQEVFTDTQGIATGLEGTLRLGYIGSAMQQIIPDLLMKMSKELPNIRFSLKEMENPDQLEALLRQEIDLGFVRMERIPPQLATMALFEDSFSIVLPKNHAITPANFTGLQQLKEEPFILFEPAYSHSYYEKVIQLFDAAGFVPQVSHRTVNASSIYRLVANGFGLSIVPTALQYGYDMDVRFIELAHLPQRTTLRVVWHQQSRNPIMERVLGLVGWTSK